MITVSTVTVRKQSRFFIPLAITSLLTVITHSLFNAGLARLPTPEVYIAAFAVSKSLMHLLESPVMMIRQTVTALVMDVPSYKRIRQFTLIVVGGIVLLFASLLYSRAVGWIFAEIMGLEGKTLQEAIVIMHVFMVFPIAASLRNFLQGMLIKFQATPILTAATVIRILYVALFVVLIDRLPLPPGVLAGLMFLTAISMEVLVLFVAKHLLVGSTRAKLKQLSVRHASGEHPVLTTRLITAFMGPLVLTSLVKTMATPIINIGLGRTMYPELAISAYTVGWSLGMIFLSPLIMFHQVPLNFITQDDDGGGQVKRFALYLGSTLSLLLGLMAFTPVGQHILAHWIGATDEITLLAVEVLRYMTVLPVLVVAREYFWGMLMQRRLTRYVGIGKMVSLAALAVAMVGTSYLALPNPALMGVIAMVSCETVEIIYLYTVTRRQQSPSTTASSPSMQ